jgi:hypothetical protein
MLSFKIMAVCIFDTLGISDRIDSITTQKPVVLNLCRRKTYSGNSSQHLVIILKEMVWRAFFMDVVGLRFCTKHLSLGERHTDNAM